MDNKEERIKDLDKAIKMIYSFFEGRTNSPEYEYWFNFRKKLIKEVNELRDI